MHIGGSSVELGKENAGSNVIHAEAKDNQEMVTSFTQFLIKSLDIHNDAGAVKAGRTSLDDARVDIRPEKGVDGTQVQGHIGQISTDNLSGNARKK
jgi:hypothetical protein